MDVVDVGRVEAKDLHADALDLQRSRKDREADDRIVRKLLVFRGS
jgi:hypothetical protein